MEDQVNEELQALAQRLAASIVNGLGTRSRWALRTALDAAETDGIAGLAVIKIPAKSKDFLDVSFTSGAVDVTTRWDVA